MDKSIKLHYIEKGSGRPLILLHGNGENSEHFHYQIDYFAEYFRVIAVDTRGHGRSPRGTEPFTIGQFADDLFNFMRDLGIVKTNLLGFSDGGNIALTFALRHPEMIDKLIINGANLNPNGVKAAVQLPIILTYRVMRLLSGKSDRLKSKIELFSLMVNQPDIAEAELRKLNVRTLVIAGKHDMIKRSHTVDIFNSLPDARLEIIPGDHFIAYKNPKCFNRTVMEFLNE